MSRIQSVLILLLSQLSAMGCLASPAEEAEHHVFAHMPPDFPAAVVRLSRLHDGLLQDVPPKRETDGSDQMGESPSIDPYTEMRDIVRWLPMLAADSDLPEASWNRVNESALTLETILVPLAELSVGSRTSAYREHAKRIEDCLRRIDSVSLDEFPGNGQPEENES